MGNHFGCRICTKLWKHYIVLSTARYPLRRRRNCNRKMCYFYLKSVLITEKKVVRFPVLGNAHPVNTSCNCKGGKDNTYKPAEQMGPAQQRKTAFLQKIIVHPFTLFFRAVYPAILSVHFIQFSNLQIFGGWVVLSKWSGYFRYLVDPMCYLRTDLRPNDTVCDQTDKNYLPSVHIIPLF